MTIQENNKDDKNKQSRLYNDDFIRFNCLFRTVIP